MENDTATPKTKTKLKLTRKTITIICSVIIAVALVAGTILIVNQIQKNRAAEASIQAYADRTSVANTAYQAAVDATKNNDPTTAYTDALAIFQAAIDGTDDSATKIEIQLKQASFYALFGNYNDAIPLLLSLKFNEDLLNYQRSDVYNQLTSAYYATDDTENAEGLTNEFNELYHGDGD